MKCSAINGVILHPLCDCLALVNFLEKEKTATPRSLVSQSYALPYSTRLGLRGDRIDNIYLLRHLRSLELRLVWFDPITTTFADRHPSELIPVHRYHENGVESSSHAVTHRRECRRRRRPSNEQTEGKGWKAENVTLFENSN